MMPYTKHLVHGIDVKPISYHKFLSLSTEHEHAIDVLIDKCCQYTPNGFVVVASYKCSCAHPIGVQKALLYRIIEMISSSTERKLAPSSSALLP